MIAPDPTRTAATALWVALGTATGALVGVALGVALGRPSAGALAGAVAGGAWSAYSRPPYLAPPPAALPPPPTPSGPVVDLEGTPMSRLAAAHQRQQRATCATCGATT